MRRASRLVVLAGLCLASMGAENSGARVVVLGQERDEPVPGPVQVASDTYRLRLGGILESTLGKDVHGNMVGLPRARLRAEALVSVVLEVGFVAEVDLSPWSTRGLKEDGPGLVRDLYARMALGNKKLLDLGEARLGLFTLPVLDEQWRPQVDALWLTGSLAREAWLPGRELAAAYEGSAYRYGFPVRGVLSMGSGITQAGLPMGLLNAVASGDSERDKPAAAQVPLTAGDPGKQDGNPSLGARLDVEPFYRWAGPGLFRVGGGVLGRPLSKGADARAAVAVDAELWTNYVNVRGSALVADTERAPFMDSKAFMVEGAVQVIPDFADVRARYDVAYGSNGLEAHRINVGAAFFYLDGASFLPLSENQDPGRANRSGHVFSLIWMRSYDLMRFDEVSRREVGMPVWDANRGTLGIEPRPFGAVGWILGADVDQLVLRVAL